MFPTVRVFIPALAATAALVACGDDDGDGFPAAGSDDGVTTMARTASTSPVGERTGTAGQATPGPLRLEPVGRFSAPLYVTGAPGDMRRVFVVEQGGRIRVVRGGRVLRRPFLDIRRLVTSGGEQGLLSMAFAPDYRRSGRFYVYYTDRQEQQRVVEYRRATADRAAARSARLVMRMADPEGNHNGGQLAFGPDGLLYIGTGDGGGADDQHGARGNAQNLGSPLGKILRIRPRASRGRPYTVPSSNPFVARRGARDEIYAYGLRNPWRFSFDRGTGDLVIADVGQNAVEEVDFVTAGDGRYPRGRGANFGWRPFEGTRRNFPGERAPGAIAPVVEKTHAAGWCSITGGYIVRDPALPALAGRYVYGDFCLGRLRSVRLEAGGASDDEALALKRVANLSSFGEDTAGRVYVTSLDGPVYRVAQ